MNKPVVGLVAGLVLGALDGATAWFTPAVRDQLSGIMVGSSVKGMVVGLLAGWFALKVRSTSKGVAFGCAMGLLFAYMVAAFPQPDGTHYYLEIMLPGFIVGGMIGFLTQVKGREPARRSSEPMRSS
jgi:hypothetical protein